MDFRKAQEKVISNIMRYGKRHNIRIDKKFAQAKLVEEVGEFYGSLMVDEGRCREVKKISKKEAKKYIGYELADIVAMAMLNAHFLDIDLYKALDEKQINKDKYKRRKNDRKK